MTTYLAIDLGTTGCRSILYDASLRELAISYEEYPLQTPQEHWAEQDAEDWWRLTCSTAKNAIRQAGCSAAEVHALSISSQGITLVPVDTELRPLCPALTWLDVRAREQTGQILRDFGDTAIFEHTGKHIDACYTQVEDGAQETLICTEAHEHNARCYGTWVVACGKAEHTHTEACFPEAAAFSAEQETATAPNIYKPLYNDWKIVKFVNSNRISAFSNDGAEEVVTPLEENGNPYLDDRTMWILPSSSTERPRRAAVRTAIATPPR